MVRALFLALMPISQVMNADHANWSSHANKCPEPYKNVFQPSRRGKNAMNQKTVHPNRMPRANRQRCECEEDQESIHLREQEYACNPKQAIAQKPK